MIWSQRKNRHRLQIFKDRDVAGRQKQSSPAVMVGEHINPQGGATLKPTELVYLAAKATGNQIVNEKPVEYEWPVGISPTKDTQCYLCGKEITEGKTIVFIENKGTHQTFILPNLIQDDLQEGKNPNELPWYCPEVRVAMKCK